MRALSANNTTTTLWRSADKLVGIVVFAACLAVAWGLVWPLRWLIGPDGQGAFVYYECWLAFLLVVGAVSALCVGSWAKRAAFTHIGMAGGVVGLGFNVSWEQPAGIVFLLGLLAAGLLASYLGCVGGAAIGWLARKVW